MNVVLFYHSLLSDWNHGNAHFLRGIATELIKRGDNVSVYEPKNSWSLENLVQEKGEAVLDEFYEYYPLLKSIRYDNALDLDLVLKQSDLVIVHEWNEHALVKAIGDRRKKYNFRLLFHDTHHRSVTDSKGISGYDLSNYDGVLAYGNVIRDIYLKNNWAKQAWTWHEAADTNVFKPINSTGYNGDLVWVGNWGDDERTKELNEFLIEPVKALGLKATIYGVRYPQHALAALKDAGISYGGWLPNYKVPEVFARYRFTVHVPRGPYTRSLPGIPTIRPFEALACGIPMLSSPWNDAEHLFTVGKDFLMVSNGSEMKQAIMKILTDDLLPEDLSAYGLSTIQQRHTCAHRVDELYGICRQLEVSNISQQTPVI